MFATSLSFGLKGSKATTANKFLYCYVKAAVAASSESFPFIPHPPFMRGALQGGLLCFQFFQGLKDKFRWLVRQVVPVP